MKAVALIFLSMVLTGCIETMAQYSGATPADVRACEYEAVKHAGAAPRGGAFGHEFFKNDLKVACMKSKGY